MSVRHYRTWSHPVTLTSYHVSKVSITPSPWLFCTSHQSVWVSLHPLFSISSTGPVLHIPSTIHDFVTCVLLPVQPSVLTLFLVFKSQPLPLELPYSSLPQSPPLVDTSCDHKFVFLLFFWCTLTFRCRCLHPSFGLLMTHYIRWPCLRSSSSLTSCHTLWPLFRSYYSLVIV